LNRALREHLSSRGFDEVETPCLVAAPGMEPEIRAFEVPFVPEMAEGAARTLYLHTSPEYAMKRLLAEGFTRIFQLGKVFRNGEIADLHNPEFTLLELYRTQADYREIMRDVEAIVCAAAHAVLRAVPGRRGKAQEAFTPSGQRVPLRLPFERLTVREAFVSRTGIDLARCKTSEELSGAARERGLSLPSGPLTFEDAFFHVFLQAVEKTLGLERPTFLVEYPASLASLSRLKPGDPSVAERFELYVGGVELANGFSELTDAVEQRRRLVEEQEQRRARSRPVYPLDERFLDALSQLPPCAGVAIGIDRLLMVLLGVARIDELLLFPARELFARPVPG
jgi:lysyl-tRNA synthetase class 2